MISKRIIFKLINNAFFRNTMENTKNQTDTNNAQYHRRESLEINPVPASVDDVAKHCP